MKSTCCVYRTCRIVTCAHRRRDFDECVRVVTCSEEREGLLKILPLELTECMTSVRSPVITKAMIRFPKHAGAVVRIQLLQCLDRMQSFDRM